MFLKHNLEQDVYVSKDGMEITESDIDDMLDDC